MVYTSLLNWLLLAVLVAVYWLLPGRARLYWLAAASILLLAFNNFMSALIVGVLVVLCLVGPRWATANPAQVRLRIWLLAAAMLLPLVFFKYPGLHGINVPTVGNDSIPDPALLVLPIGISYFTFKALMYVLDVSRGRYVAAGLTSLVAYLAFAPTLSAGPIDRPAALINELMARTRLTADQLLYAGYRIALGMIYKFAFADVLMDLASSFRATVMAVTLWKKLAFGPFYAALIYCDFAGYSHIAIGVAALLGIRCMENFAAPYLRRNISEFWRAWHISLTSFLTDYIFTPLANAWARPLSKRWGWSRGSLAAGMVAAVVTFVICGIWHGNGLNFVLWGLYHGVLLALHQWFLHATKKSPLFKRLRKQRWLAAPSTLFTFALVCVSWYLFAISVPDLIKIIRGIP